MEATSLVRLATVYQKQVSVEYIIVHKVKQTCIKGAHSHRLISCDCSVHFSFWDPVTTLYFVFDMVLCGPVNDY